MKESSERRIHQVFEISVILKGVHALIETFGGILLFFVSTSTIANLLETLSSEQLSEDSNDYIARSLQYAADQVSVGKSFAAFYLLSHGLIKLVLVGGLLRDKKWAYPAAIMALILFIAYQLYRYSHTHAIGLVLLSIFDAFMLWLVIHEYRLKLRTERLAHTAEQV